MTTIIHSDVSEVCFRYQFECTNNTKSWECIEWERHAVLSLAEQLSSQVTFSLPLAKLQLGVFIWRLFVPERKGAF